MLAGFVGKFLDSGPIASSRFAGRVLIRLQFRVIGKRARAFEQGGKVRQLLCQHLEPYAHQRQVAGSLCVSW